MAQMTLDIGDGRSLVFHFLSIRTSEYLVEPVTDPSGVHNELVRVTMDITGIVNEVSIATAKGVPGIVSRTNTGDRLPITMHRIRDLLMHNRRRVVFEIGDQEVIHLPRPLPGGLNLSCDAKGGPFPQRASFTPIIGEKSCVLSYRVVCYDTYNSQILLSNAWSMSSEVDRNGFTTRTLNGRAAFRLDLLTASGLTADDFRHALIVPAPDNMRRLGVKVDVSTDGRELFYMVTDRDVNYGMGADSNVTEVTGSVTSVTAFPVRNYKAMTEKVWNELVWAKGWDIFANHRFVWNNVVPVVTNVGIARATGKPACDRQSLWAVAVSFLTDRFAPVFGERHMMCLIGVTQGVDSERAPYCEARMEVYPAGPNVLEVVRKVNPLKLQKFDHEISTRLGVVASIDRAATELPRSDNARYNVYRMVMQALKAPPTFADPTDPNLPASTAVPGRSRDAAVR